MASSLRGMCMPRHLSSQRGRGWRECQASGFVRSADDVVDDVRQGAVAEEFADVTPGFGTFHPQDVRGSERYDDPSPIENARPITRTNLSKQDLQISDAEVLLALREGRAPRPGY